MNSIVYVQVVGGMCMCIEIILRWRGTRVFVTGRAERLSELGLALNRSLFQAPEDFNVNTSQRPQLPRHLELSHSPIPSEQ